MPTISVSAIASYTRNIYTGEITNGAWLYYDDSETCKYNEVLAIFSVTLPMWPYNYYLCDPILSPATAYQLQPCSPAGYTAYIAQGGDDPYMFTECKLVDAVDVVDKDIWNLPTITVATGGFYITGTAPNKYFSNPNTNLKYQLPVMLRNRLNKERTTTIAYRLRIRSKAETGVVGTRIFSLQGTPNLSITISAITNNHTANLGILAHSHSLGQVTITGNYDTSSTTRGPAIPPATNALQNKSGVLKLASTTPVNGITYLNYVNT